MGAPGGISRQVAAILGAKRFPQGSPGGSKMESKIDCGLKVVKSQKKSNTSYTKKILLKVQGLQNRAQNGVKIGSKAHLRRGDPRNASREALGAFLEASGAGKKKLGTALCRFRSKKGAKMGAKMAPQNAPRCLHEAKMLQEGSKRPLGTDFNPLWEPSGPQKQRFAH